jgi:hypothetical protein
MQEVTRALLEHEQKIDTRCDAACKRSYHQMMSAGTEDPNSFANRMADVISKSNDYCKGYLGFT